MAAIFKKLGLPYVDYNLELLLLGLILARIMPMVFLSPFLGGRLVPSVVKMGLGMAITLLVWPVARGQLVGAIPQDAVGFLVLLLKEVFLGVAIGFTASHLFYAMDVAGRLIDTARGTTMSEIHSPLAQQRVTITGNLYFHLMVVFFMAVGGHLVFLEIFFHTFRILPINMGLSVGPGFEAFFDLIARITANILLIAAVISAPAVAATFITDLVFGILNRVAPQLNAYFLSMPVKAVAGLILVLVTLEAFAERSVTFFSASLLELRDVLELLAGGSAL